MAADESPIAKTLFTNVDVFDSEHEKLAEGKSVLVESNKISKIAKSIPPPAGATVIDGKGRMLTRGLMDAHYHIDNYNYNHRWLPEKNRGRNPREMRQYWIPAQEMDAEA